MQADLVERPDQLRRGDGVADPQPGQSVRLGEGAQAHEPGVFGLKRQQLFGRRELEIGFVQQEEAIVRQAFQQCCDAVAAEECAGWIVRVGKVEQLCPFLAGSLGQSLGVVMEILAVGHLDKPSAVPGHVIIEGWIGAERGHHGVAGIDEGADQQAQNSIYSLSNHDIGALAARLGGQRLAQIVVLGVAVPVGALCFGLQHRLRLGGDTKGAFVRTQAQAVGVAALALQRFRPDEGCAGGQALQYRGVAGGHGGSPLIVDGASGLPRPRLLV